MDLSKRNMQNFKVHLMMIYFVVDNLVAFNEVNNQLLYSN